MPSTVSRGARAATRPTTTPGLCAFARVCGSSTRRSGCSSRVTTYLSFLEHARCPVRGFHNFLSYQRDWLDAEGTRRLPGPGGPRSGRSARQQSARRIPRVGPRVDRRGHARAGRPAEPAGSSLRDPGLGASVECGGEDIEPLETVAWSAAQRLVECYHRSQRPDWPWFESRMTYANAVLPHALFIAASAGRRRTSST